MPAPFSNTPERPPTNTLTTDMAATAGTLRRYHEATKHSLASVTSSTHRLDWANKPLPFKVFTDLPKIEPPDDLLRLLRYSNGVLRWRRTMDGEVYGFRAAPATGALYQIEFYLATAERRDLPAGLYHYSAHDDGLRRLREGDVRQVLFEASGNFAPLASAPIILVLTSTFWRNSWKYESRAYRHSYWDSGVILANLLALLDANRTSASVVMGFVDRTVNRLVGADGEREAAVAMVAIGEGSLVPPAAIPLPDIDYPTMPLSLRQVRYPRIVEAHQASSLESPDQVTAWRKHASNTGGPPPHASLPLAGRAVGQHSSLPLAGRVGEGVEDVIMRRRSTRRFAGQAISRSELQGLLDAALTPIPGDAFDDHLIQTFLIVNAVEGLQRGKYSADLSLIEAGDYRRDAAELALGQPIAGQAAVNVYFMVDLEAVFARLGERGYRAAQMAGAIAGGRLELEATALGLGATGLTFFDDDATEFFEPAAEGRQVMYLAAAGHPARACTP